MIRIYGPLPPPFGGVSVHLARLKPLIEERGIDAIFFNQYGSSRISFIFMLLRDLLSDKKVHLHCYHPLLIPILYLISRLKTLNLLVTIHNERYIKSSMAVLWFFFITRIKCRALVVVSNSLYEWLSQDKRNRVYRISAYIPPNKPIFYSNDKMRLVFNMFACDGKKFHEYGVDIFLRIINHFDDFEAVLFLGDANSIEDLDDRMISFCQSAKLTRRPKIIAGRYMPDLISSKDILIRPNRADAYGVSVKEIIDMGLVAIASDVCIRPTGAVICSSYDDYLDAIRSAQKLYSMNDFGVDTLRDYKADWESAYKILDLYESW